MLEQGTRAIRGGGQKAMGTAPESRQASGWSDTMKDADAHTTGISNWHNGSLSSLQGVLWSNLRSKPTRRRNMKRH